MLAWIAVGLIILSVLGPVASTILGSVGCVLLLTAVALLLERAFQVSGA